MFCKNTSERVNKLMIKLRALPDEDIKFIEKIVNSLQSR